jgi:hypothetical protein
MENNSITNALLKTDTQSVITTPSTSDNSGFFSGVFESIQNINYTTWIIIILILAFLGFNIFIYLAKGTQDITNLFNIISQKIKGGMSADKDHDDDHDLQPTNIKDSPAKTSVKPQPVQNIELEHKTDPIANTTLNKSLNSKHSEDNDDYTAHDAHSSLDITGKAGWCYIGEDRGFRSCSEVGVNDKCMSGDIFPSQEICVNPNLRK